MNPLNLIRGAWGLLLLARPRLVLRELGGASSAGVRVATRVLGARHAGEALLIAIRRDRVTPRWTMVIDAIHVASMVVVARESRRLRRDALASAAASGSLALAGAAARAASLRS